jgi:hypothetical protein
MQTPRPTLDSITVWRAQQIADSEHRSLANAVHILVKEAFDRRVEAMVRAAAPNMPRGVKSAS